MCNVWHCVFNVNQLQAVAFINASVKTVNVKSEKLNERPDGLTLLRFSCDIYSVDIDVRICQKKMTFSSTSDLRNISTKSPPGPSRSSSLAANTSKCPRGVRVV